MVAGNVAGFGVGVVEGTAQGFAAPFNPNYHMVRYWRTETTSDGRTIQVPYDILVDQYGRPVHMPAPTGNPKPPPIATTHGRTANRRTRATASRNAAGSAGEPIPTRHEWRAPVI